MKRSERIQQQIDWMEKSLQLGEITSTEYIRLTQDLLNDKEQALKEEVNGAS